MEEILYIDRATQFTLKLFSIFEERFFIKWTSDNVPVFVSSEVNEFSMQRLRNDLMDLYKSSDKDDAIVDMEATQKEHKIIQTTGVGFAEDLDLFTKLGFLLGDRLILWDTMIQTFLAKPVGSVNVLDFGLIVCDLLHFKPIIKDGGLAILPHPITWLDRTKHYISRATESGQLGTEVLGLLNAMALLDEGIALHPYSMESDRENFRMAKSAMHIKSDLMQDTDLEYHDKLANFMENRQFLFFKDISANAFYSYLGPREHRSELRKLLSSSSLGESEIEKEASLQLAIKGISDEIEKQNSNIILSHAPVGAAALGAIGATMAFINDAYKSAAFITLLAGALGTISKWEPLFRDLVIPRRNPTIYQVFYNMKKAAEEEEIRRQTEIWRNLDTVR
jgi:hypothetical protein